MLGSFFRSARSSCSWLRIRRGWSAGICSRVGPDVARSANNRLNGSFRSVAFPVQTPCFDVHWLLLLRHLSFSHVFLSSDPKGHVCLESPIYDGAGNLRNLH